MDDFEPGPDAGHDARMEEQAELESERERSTGKVRVMWIPDRTQPWWKFYGDFPRGDAFRIVQELRDDNIPAKVA